MHWTNLHSLTVCAVDVPCTWCTQKRTTDNWESYNSSYIYNQHTEKKHNQKGTILCSESFPFPFSQVKDSRELILLKIRAFNTQSPQPEQLTPTHRWKEKELHVNVFESKGKVNSCTSKILTFCYNIVNNSHTRSKLNEISQMINLQKQNNIISLKARYLSPLSSSGACHSCCSKWRQITK